MSGNIVLSFTIIRNLAVSNDDDSAMMYIIWELTYVTRLYIHIDIYIRRTTWSGSNQIV